MESVTRSHYTRCHDNHVIGVRLALYVFQKLTSAYLIHFYQLINNGERCRKLHYTTMISYKRVVLQSRITARVRQLVCHVTEETTRTCQVAVPSLPARISANWAKLYSHCDSV